MRNNFLSAAVYSLVCKYNAGFGCSEDHMSFTCTATDGTCFKKIEWDGDNKFFTYGCTSHGLLQSKVDHSLFKIRRGLFCRKTRHLCNEDHVLTLPPVATPSEYFGTVSTPVTTPPGDLGTVLSPVTTPPGISVLSYHQKQLPQGI